MDVTSQPCVQTTVVFLTMLMLMLSAQYIFHHDFSLGARQETIITHKQQKKGMKEENKPTQTDSICSTKTHNSK